MKFVIGFEKIKRIASQALIYIILFLIRLYKSVPLAPRCRFLPSCSDYAVMHLQQDGPRAIFRIIWRILCCNPLSKQSVRLK